MSAASAAVPVNANTQAAIKCVRMPSKPSLARFPFVLPTGEAASAELQIQPLLHEGRIDAGNRRRLADHVDFRFVTLPDVTHARAEGRRRLVGGHAEVHNLARRAGTAECQPPNAKKCDDPPHHRTISRKHRGRNGGLDAMPMPSHNSVMASESSKSPPPPANEPNIVRFPATRNS